uniref:Uncharacterized protein n=1 Tax=Panagrolaimus superbus TaxID=310955 RepID=A0A914Z4H4_9BILA
MFLFLVLGVEFLITQVHNLIFKRNREDFHNIVNDVNVRYWGPKANVLAKTVEGFSENDTLRWHQSTEKLVESLKVNNPDTNFSRPDEDVLALPISGGGVVVVNHPDTRNEPILHLAPIGAICSIQYPKKQENGHDESYENGTNGVQHNEMDSEEAWNQSIYKVRQDFIAKENLRALDAGFDSVIAAIEGSRIDSWSVVLGIADYFQGNSRGAQEWKPYAAANAASLLREAILRFPN